MPKSNKKSLSRKYLKILGVITLVMGIVLVIGGVASMFVKYDVSTLPNIEELRKTTTDENAIRAAIGIVILLSAAVSLLEGWLLMRAANDPSKSTLLLVILVFSCISGFVQLFQQGFGNVGATTGTVFNLTINILCLMAVMKSRSEIDM